MSSVTEKTEQKLGFWKRLIQVLTTMDYSELDYVWQSINDRDKTIRRLELQVNELQSLIANQSGIQK